MKTIFKTSLLAAVLAGALPIAAPPASATYVVEMHTISGIVQKIDTKASRLTVNGLTIGISSQTRFRGASGLYDLAPGTHVTVRYYGTPGAKNAGVAVEIDVTATKS